MSSLKQYLIALSLLLVLFSTKGQSEEMIHLIPKRGIVLNADSILKEKITIDGLCKLLKIQYKKDTTFINIEHRDWVNVKTGESGGDTRVFEEIYYKSIVFKFVSNYVKDKKILDHIEVKDANEFIIFTSDGYSLSGSNPKIQEFFPFMKDMDSVSSDKLTINLNTYGMWFHFKKIKDVDFRITNLSMNLE